MQPRRHPEQRSTPSRQREIELSWGTHLDVPDMRGLQVECDDEITTLLFAGPALFDESDPEALLAGPIGEMAINEHRSRCAACQRWEGAA